MAKLPGTAITDGTITATQLAAANVDGAANVASMRTLGTGEQQAAAGNHGHANAIAAGAAGFLSGADKTKLDGIESGADVTDTANVQAAHPISTAVSLLKDASDGTKRLAFNLEAIAPNPGAIRTIIMPNQDVDLTPNAVAGTASPRSLGTGAQEAAAGNHAHASTAITADSSGLTNITGSTVAAQMTSIDGQLMHRQLVAGDANTQIELLFAESAAPFANSGQYGALPFSKGGAATVLAQQAGFLGDYAISVLNSGDRGGLTSGNTSACESGSAITLSGWFRFGAVNGGFAITKLYNLAGQQWGLNGKFASIALVAYADDVEAHYNIGGTNQSLIKSANGISPAGSWNFFAATYDGSYMRTYVNGALVATSANHAAALDWGSHGPWCIGGLDATSLGGGSSNQYCGLIYRPRIENVVRSRAYLAEVYYRGVGLPAAGL